MEPLIYFYPDSECDDWEVNCGTNNNGTGNSSENPSQSQSPHDKGIFTHGYEELSGVYVVAQEGTTIETDVNITVEIVPEDQLLQWKSEVEKHLDDERKKWLTSIYETQGHVTWIATLWNLFYGNNQSNLPQWEFSTGRSEDLYKLAEAFHNLTMAKFSVKGKIKVTGIGPGPAEASVFIQQAKIKFLDNKEFNIISTRNPHVEPVSGFGQLAVESTALNIQPI